MTRATPKRTGWNIHPWCRIAFWPEIHTSFGPVPHWSWTTPVWTLSGAFYPASTQCAAGAGVTAARSAEDSLFVGCTDGVGELRGGWGDTVLDVNGFWYDISGSAVVIGGGAFSAH